MSTHGEPALERFALHGRTVIVTGAGRGLGRGIALALLQAGASVLGVGREGAHLDETAARAGNRAHQFRWIAADLSNDGALEAVSDAAWSAGAVTGVVHAAGVQLRKPAIEVSREEWRRITTIQLEVPFFLSTALARRQIESRIEGSHVFVGSLTSWLGIPRLAPYAASKSGLLGIVRTLAAEWASRHIRANIISPGYYLTDMTEDLFSDSTRREAMLQRIPMGRFGEAEDLAGAAIFLLSDSSAYITGQSINVDGGWLAT
jgi:NAD(P)-dependent dehydrogenase (short-subunit alcohol dehydrogenase family)